jgi:antitoxin YqcF
MYENWGDCYFVHYERYFRRPGRVRQYSQSPDQPNIQVLEYDKVLPGCRLFASVGLTHYANIVGGYSEVILPVDAGWDQVSEVLANALFYVVQNGMKMERGLVVGGIQNVRPEFARAFGKTALYFTNPFGLPEGVGTVQYDQQVGRVYLAIFITQAEHDYLLKGGEEDFESMLESCRVDPYALHRPSCVQAGRG